MTDKCPKCGGETELLAGISAHPENWFCKDKDGCGYKSWADRPQPSQPSRPRYDYNQNHRGPVEVPPRRAATTIESELTALRSELDRKDGVIAAGRELQAELVDALEAYLRAGIANSTDFYKQGEASEVARALLRKHGRL